MKLIRQKFLIPIVMLQVILQSQSAWAGWQESLLAFFLAATALVSAKTASIELINAPQELNKPWQMEYIRCGRNTKVLNLDYNVLEGSPLDAQTALADNSSTLPDVVWISKSLRPQNLGEESAQDQNSVQVLSVGNVEVDGVPQFRFRHVKVRKNTNSRGELESEATRSAEPVEKLIISVRPLEGGVCGSRLPHQPQVNWTHIVLEPGTE